ncbi:MAG TPA: hypothetical protein VFN61_05165 [Acidimicrobiales bacterium]|nr:hypothetical protein [Acidimicrobiales bacterium]
MARRQWHSAIVAPAATKSQFLDLSAEPLLSTVAEPRASGREHNGAPDTRSLYRAVLLALLRGREPGGAHGRAGGKIAILAAGSCEYGHVPEHGLDLLMSGCGGSRVAWADVPEEVGDAKEVPPSPYQSKEPNL